MGMIVPILQIRKRIAEESTVRVVVGTDCKAHGSPLQHIASTETFWQWEKGVMERKDL